MAQVMHVDLINLQLRGSELAGAIREGKPIEHDALNLLVAVERLLAEQGLGLLNQVDLEARKYNLQALLAVKED